jgi:hypothetical protein
LKFPALTNWGKTYPAPVFGGEKCCKTCCERVAKNIVHGDGIGKKMLHITIPEKNSLPAVNHPPPPSKVKWSAPKVKF